MKFIKINTQNDMENFISSIYWEHAFFREIYIQSPEYITLDGLKCANPESLVNIAIFIMTSDNDHPGIELKIEEALKISLPFKIDLEPSGKVGNGFVDFYFNRENSLRARSISFRFHGKEVFGDKYRYGKFWFEIFE